MEMHVNKKKEVFPPFFPTINLYLVFLIGRIYQETIKGKYNFAEY